MIETKPRINRGNRGQLFRATWLSSARCSETKIYYASHHELIPIFSSSKSLFARQLYLKVFVSERNEGSSNISALLCHGHAEPRGFRYRQRFVSPQQPIGQRVVKYFLK